MAKPMCETCWLRGCYDRKAQSLLGRLWRWHAGWCPGWKSYLNTLPEDERTRLAEHYQLDKFRL
jgi:hypothetical protein